MSTSGTSHSHIQILHKYTACDIADALVKLKVPNAGYLSDLQLYTPISGRSQKRVSIAPASTVVFAAKAGGDASKLPASNIPSGQHWVDLTEPGTIVVMSQPEGQKCAVLGGIMALRMKVLNAEGVIVHGRVRDLDELAETGLPIWAQSTSIIGSGFEAKPQAIQVSLDLDGTIVNPGDLIFSDPTNGVIVIPQDRVADVVDLLPQLVEADDRVKEDVLKGMTVTDAFKKHRSH